MPRESPETAVKLSNKITDHTVVSNLASVLPVVIRCKGCPDSTLHSLIVSVEPEENNKTFD